jgi:hypothetical protein
MDKYKTNIGFTFYRNPIAESLKKDFEQMTSFQAMLELEKNIPQLEELKEIQPYLNKTLVRVLACFEDFYPALYRYHPPFGEK